MLSRRAFLTLPPTLALAACARSAPPASPTGSSRYAADFDAMWETTRDRYCFFADKATDFDAVRALYRPLAARAQSDVELYEAIDSALAELYDPHCHVNVDRDGARRFLPSDLWAEWRGGRAIVTNARTDSMASRAEVSPGDEVLAIDGRPIADAARAEGPRCLRQPDPAADQWALLAALAGRLTVPRTLRLRMRDGRTRDAALTPRPADAGVGPEPPAVASRRIDRFGYVRIASFADEAIVPAFDAAVNAFHDTDGLVLDVRENGGGDTAYARPMMGRFIRFRRRYAWMARRAPGSPALGDRWEEFVEPRGPFAYERPVVILVDRFSASMAEGFPMGMRGIAGASIVGTPMAGLGAAIFSFELPSTRARVQISAEPVYDSVGRPRWRLEPDVLVRLESQSSDAPGDPILAAGLATLTKLVGATVSR